MLLYVQYIINSICHFSTLCNECDKVADFVRKHACVRDWQLDHTRSPRYFLSQALGKGYIPTSLSAQMTYSITALVNEILYNAPTNQLIRPYIVLTAREFSFPHAVILQVILRVQTSWDIQRFSSVRDEKYINLSAILIY